MHSRCMYYNEQLQSSLRWLEELSVLDVDVSSDFDCISSVL